MSTAQESTAWSIVEVARLAGVSSRTLRHYDDVGLLPPAYVGSNGYRYYGRDELHRLQEVLVLRELGLPLDAIAQRFGAAGLTDADEPVITYCGGGIAASVAFFALKLLGRERVALYDNSLLEWSADSRRPMAR